MLVQTVQKIVEDNERLSQECNLKTQRIDELREKVTELLEKNKRYARCTMCCVCALVITH